MYWSKQIYLLKHFHYSIFSARAQAKPDTVERIQDITFSRSGYGQGDGFYDRPGSGTAYPPGRPGSVNIYGGEVKLGGRLDIQHPQSSM